jgi:oligopeptide/dipeptide ABC transporter ATP-binding protein
MGALIRAENLKKYFPVHKSGLIRQKRMELKAVDGVSFEIDQGQTFGLVGESGCGKTTIGKLLLKLYGVTSGKIFFRGKDVTQIEGVALDQYRKNIQAVFQSPYASLNRRMRIWRIIGEPLAVQSQPKKKVKEKVVELLDLVGLPIDCSSRFPHEMSEGQRQQIAIARALSINPKFIVLDEPTSLLDVSAQSSILNMIVEFQAKLNLTYLFISHNLAVVRYLSNQIGVMYCGKLVELANGRVLYTRPKHPYTQALLSSVPEPDPGLRGSEIVLDGDVISPINPPEGCRFYSRCHKRRQVCEEDEPPLHEMASGHFIACHLFA